MKPETPNFGKSFYEKDKNSVSEPLAESRTSSNTESPHNTSDAPSQLRPAMGFKKTSPQTSKTKSKMAKKLWIILGVIGACLLTVGVALLVANPVFKFNAAKNENDFDTAAAIYNAKIQGSDVRRFLVDKAVNNDINQLELSYQTMEKNYDDTLSELDFYKKLHGFEDACSGAMKEIENAKASFDAYEKGQKLIDGKKYEAAIGELEKVTENSPNYKDSQSKIETAKLSMKKEVFFQIDKADPEKLSYEEQLSLLSGLENVLGADDEITAKSDGIKEVYRLQVLQKSEALLKESGVLSATDLIRSALAILKNDETLLAKIDEYSVLAPIPIVSLESYSYTGKGLKHISSDEGSRKDNLGNEYAVDETIIQTGSIASNTYYIDGQYTTITGRVYLMFQRRAHTLHMYASVFRIYGDDALLYEAPEFYSGVNPVDFKVNINGVKYLKIEMGERHGLDIIAATNIMLNKI
ncbi:MAG: NPCBM/NEW2 domain-containing protein [Oscillospiraceae bacterium]